MSTFTFTLNSLVPAGVSTALSTIATAVATVPGRDSQLAAQKLGEFEAFINAFYRV